MLSFIFLLFVALTSAQYVSDQQYQPQVQYVPTQYLQVQDNQQFAPASPHRPARPPPPPPPLPQQPPTRISQLLLPSAVDRQVQQAANNIAGPEYAQQVQSVQLQGLADQAQAIAQRRAQVTAQRIAQANVRQVQSQYIQQQQPELQQQPQPQSLSPTYRYVNPSERTSENVQPKEDYDPNPSYQFGFDVNDDYHTNYQNRKEQRNGEKITGSYSVVDSDGFIRTVTYTADPKEGFKAEVNRQPTNIVVKVPKPAPQHLNQEQYLQNSQEVNPQNQGQQKYVYKYQ